MIAPFVALPRASHHRNADEAEAQPANPPNAPHIGRPRAGEGWMAAGPADNSPPVNSFHLQVKPSLETGDRVFIDGPTAL